MDRGKRQDFSSFFSGSRAYIALGLCAAAVLGGCVYLLAAAGQEGPELTPAPPKIVTDSPALPVQPPAREEQRPVSAPVTVVMPEAEDIPTEVPEEAAEEIVSPLAGETVSAFSADMPQYNETTRDWRVHTGVDIRASAGTEVAAACSGTVTSAGMDDRLGMTVVIDHGEGLTTTYAGLEEEAEVSAGDQVSAGDIVGRVGNTTLTESALGAHLHFEVSRDGESVDPAEFLPE